VIGILSLSNMNHPVCLLIGSLFAAVIALWTIDSKCAYITVMCAHRHSGPRL